MHTFKLGVDYTIEDLQPHQYSDFYRLNASWISDYFFMEPRDEMILNHPGEYILDKGGVILAAVAHGKVIGVCALLKSESKAGEYELSKMGVQKEMQGRKIGEQLALEMINRAKKLGAERIYLESSTKLPPALALYRKLGFNMYSGPASPYQRSDIQMELILKEIQS